jgi:hypothetical protein
MTPKEREKLIVDMAQGMAFVTPYLWAKFTKGEKSRMIDDARAALTIAERRIREDCAEIVNAHKPTRDTPAHNLVGHCFGIVADAILASIPETKP